MRTGKRLAKTQWQSLWLTIDRWCSRSARTRRFDDGMQKVGNCTKPSDPGDNVLNSLSGFHAWDIFFDFSTTGPYVLLTSRRRALELWDYASRSHSVALCALR